MPDSRPQSREQIASQRLAEVVTKLNAVATSYVPNWTPTRVNSHRHLINAVLNNARVLAPQIVQSRADQEGMLYSRMSAVLCEYGISEYGLRLIVFYLSIP